MIWKLDSALVFRWYLLGWAQMIELVCLQRQVLTKDRERIQSPKQVFSIKDRIMDNAQKCDSYHKFIDLRHTLVLLLCFV
jgi:hypothetical protein